MPGLEIQTKHEFHIWRWLFTALLILGLAVCGWYAYRWYTTGEEPPLPIPVAALAEPRVDESEVSAQDRTAYTVPADHPRYVSIPALGIEDSRVRAVGVNEFGNLSTPYNIHDTAWYDKSATPGMGYGAVMIDGHNGGYSKDGVFAKIATLKNGDKIVVERGDGKKFTYAVTSNRTVTLEEANTSGMKELLQSSDPDKEGLSLISCAGNYVPRLQAFDHRVMVRAVLQSPSASGS